MTTLLRRPKSGPAAMTTADTRLPSNLNRMRKERGLTLDALSLKSGVSRAMISKIERGVAIPTATVLGKLASGLGTGLSVLLGSFQTREPMLLPPAEQPIFRDPESGLERRSLSPLFPDRSVDFALNTLPPKAQVSFPPHHHGVEEYLYVSRGALTVVVGDQTFFVAQGSSLFYHGHLVHEFHNQGDDVAEFFIVVDGTAAG